MIRNPAEHLAHAAKPVVSARFYDIPADAIQRAGGKPTPTAKGTALLASKPAINPPNPTSAGARGVKKVGGTRKRP